MDAQALAQFALNLAQQAEATGNTQAPDTEGTLRRARSYLAFLTQTEAVVKTFSEAQKHVLEDAQIEATAAAQAVLNPAPATPAPVTTVAVTS